MRASLFSATSLLALLLLDGREAAAGPIVNIGAAISPPSSFARSRDTGPGSNIQTNAAETLFTPLTPGTVTMTAADSGFAQVGEPVLSRLADSLHSDIGQPAIVRTGSQAGTAGTGNSVFVGTVGHLVVLDGPASLPSAASASFAYTIAPANKTAATPTIAPMDPDDPGKPGTPAVTIDPGAAPGLPLDPVRGTATSTSTTTGDLGYAYTPLGRSRSASVVPLGNKPSAPSNGTAKGAPPASALTSSVPGASVFYTANPVADAPVGPGSSKPTSRATNTEAVNSVYQALQRTTVQATLAAGGFRTAESDPSTFSVSPQPDSSAPVPVPLKIVVSGTGELPSSLMIFAAASASGDDAGDTLSFFFNGGVVQ